MAARCHSFGERPKNRGPRAPKTALTASAWKSRGIHASVTLRAARRIPRLAQQGHDVALALRPCVVEGRLADIGSECRIGAPFEKTLGDREVAVDCSPMQGCGIVVLLTRANG